MRHRRPRAGRPLPHRQPVLPHVRLQGRNPRLPARAARRSCPSRCSTSTAVLRRVAARADLDAARCRRRSTSSILNHPDRGRVRPVVAATRRHRRRARPGRDDPADARGAHVRHDHHRLRPDRVDRHGHDVPSRRRRRDDRRHVRAGDHRCRGAHRRRRRHRTRRRTPGEIVVPRLQRDGRATSRTPKRPPRRSTPTAGCTPATSA